jgi:hypothetical protein
VPAISGSNDLRTTPGCPPPDCGEVIERIELDVVVDVDLSLRQLAPPGAGSVSFAVGEGAGVGGRRADRRLARVAGREREQSGARAERRESNGALRTNDPLHTKRTADRGRGSADFARKTAGRVTRWGFLTDAAAEE